VSRPRVGRGRPRMIDGDPPWCAAARSLGAVHGPAVAAGPGGRWLRHICMPVGRAPAGHPRQATVAMGRSSIGGERGVAEARQGVAHAPGELARHRQGGPVAALAGFDLLVVGVAGGAGTGGGLGGLKQRPAQHLWSLCRGLHFILSTLRHLRAVQGWRQLALRVGAHD
jgi:hypothetical protein